MLLWHFTALILVAVVILPLGIVPDPPRRLARLVVPARSPPWSSWPRRSPCSSPCSVGSSAAVRPSIAPPVRGAGRRAAVVPGPAVAAAMVASVVLSAVAFGLIAVGGLSTGRGWLGSRWCRSCCSLRPPC